MRDLALKKLSEQYMEKLSKYRSEAVFRGLFSNKLNYGLYQRFSLDLEELHAKYPADIPRESIKFEIDVLETIKDRATNQINRVGWTAGFVASGLALMAVMTKVGGEKYELYGGIFLGVYGFLVVSWIVISKISPSDQIAYINDLIRLYREKLNQP